MLLPGNAGMYVVRPPRAEPVPHKIKVRADAMLESFGKPGWDLCSADVPAAG